MEKRVYRAKPILHHYGPGSMMKPKLGDRINTFSGGLRQGGSRAPEPARAVLTISSSIQVPKSEATGSPEGEEAEDGDSSIKIIR